jgi:hypothetical protein
MMFTQLDGLQCSNGTQPAKRKDILMKLPLKNANRTMDLLNKTCCKGVPAIGSQDGDDAIVYLKFFLQGHTWFLTELDVETGEAFGKVFSQQCPDGELGYFSMIELSTVRGTFGAVERDRHFKPTPLADVKNPCG